MSQATRQKQGDSGACKQAGKNCMGGDHQWQAIHEELCALIEQQTATRHQSKRLNRVIHDFAKDTKIG